jgi:hypothetical protein
MAYAAPGAYATVAGSATETLYTTGPVRPGFILVGESVDVTFSNDPAYPNDVAIAVGSLSETCSAPPGPIGPCSGLLGSQNGNPHRILPFTLGEPFTFSIGIDINAQGFPSTVFSGNGTSSGYFSFSLFEADGTTIVPMYLAPEPGTWTLCGLCGFSLLFYRRFRK